jgi:hypothetical protein
VGRELPHCAEAAEIPKRGDEVVPGLFEPASMEEFDGVLKSKRRTPEQALTAPKEAYCIWLVPRSKILREMCSTVC